MTSTTKKVFFLGASGYIGGAIFVKLHDTFPKYEWVALNRNPKTNDRLLAAGFSRVVQGSHSDLEIIEALCAAADIVVNCADADDLPLAQAVLRGHKSAYERTGQRPVLVHTSGTGVVTDKAEGQLTAEAREKIYNDNSEADIRSIPEDKPHRDVDLTIFRAGEEGYVNAYIIAPSTIYATGKGPVRNISQQIPNIVRWTLKRGKGFVIGEGTNIWPGVHIDDLADLYALVLQKALKEDAVSSKESPFARFYFGTACEFNYGDVEKRVAEILHKKGKISQKDADPVSLKEAIAFEPALGSVARNSRTKADRGLALAWKPKSTSVFDTLEEDIDQTILQG
ncbi:NAD(P)-binding protein [Exidia glandulosa HHB12029]|uniref:NAD(P)-binding protein n=1 Tax=Exidia glandulosa HHB12029 TaxID=1314781 RepID=A0A165PCW0_EXIGL|nr:NAD(P)-binding protein [Exidia glandulosa HHB12029]